VFVGTGQALKYFSVMKHGEIYQLISLATGHADKGLSYQGTVTQTRRK
jgi:hypothetical protein